MAAVNTRQYDIMPNAIVGRCGRARQAVPTSSGGRWSFDGSEIASLVPSASLTEAARSPGRSVDLQSHTEQAQQIT